eukprot:1158825-Pelagomonas_calceolata.AAC.6
MRPCLIQKQFLPVICFCETDGIPKEARSREPLLTWVGQAQSLTQVAFSIGQACSHGLGKPSPSPRLLSPLGKPAHLGWASPAPLVEHAGAPHRGAPCADTRPIGPHPCDSASGLVA